VSPDANADHVRAVIDEAASGEGIQAVVLDCETMPSVDVTAARMLAQLAADLRHRGVRLVLAGEIGQVRDMLAATSQDTAPEYYRTVAEAVGAVSPPPTGTPAREA
jgi:SulP family sulfate permease